jgi:hypothetical protein
MFMPSRISPALGLALCLSASAASADGPGLGKPLTEAAGKMFAHQHFGVSPDIIAVAKGISSAYLPIAARVVKNCVFDSFYGAPAENR